MTTPIVADRPDSGPGPHLAGCPGSECAPVPARGTARRLRALAYNGFSTADLAARLGVPYQVVRRLQYGQPPEVLAGRAASVSALSDAVWHLKGGSPGTAEDARRRGWCPPLAWDDSPGDPYFIDDPAASPAPDWQPNMQRRRLTLDEQATEVSELVRWGLSFNQAALRLGISGAALTRVRDHMAVGEVAS
jgi:hypothetical protein